MSRKSGVLAPIAALGIVFGDIGTSPLYAIKELIYRSGSDHSSEGSIGAISLVIWLLTIVICIKYVWIVLRADNAEQGGVFALLALLSGNRARTAIALSGLLIFGAGMLLGDGLITPAISVLSAVEGLSVASSSFSSYTVLITLGILTTLFAVQRKGTEKVGQVFGPIMLVWFGFLAIVGFRSLLTEPKILEALNPVHAVEFLSSLSLHHLTLALGSVILVVTGGEALFADLGHLGKRPIRHAWLMIVYPALVLNYLGQGAYVLSGQEVIDHNIFFSMVPGVLLYPSVVLATLATVIASQALISAAFSLVAQGIALKYLPTMRVIHTHDEREGQLYIPIVNWVLFAGAAFLVVTFRSSSHLAAAYGLAVAADMVITVLAVAAIARFRWRWKKPAIAAVFIPLGIIDVSLLAGNIWKIPGGGYVPLIIGISMVLIMTTWRWGRERVRIAIMQHSTLPMSDIISIMRNKEAPIFPRPMVLLTAYVPTKPTDLVPPLLELFFRRYGALPQHLILLQINQVHRSYVSPAERYGVIDFKEYVPSSTSLISVSASFGFREQPDVEDVIADIIRHADLNSDDDLSTWMIHAAKERIVGAEGGGVFSKLRHDLFKTLRRQADPAYAYFGLDDDARLTVELVPVTI